MSLKALFEVHAAKTDKELKIGQNFMLRCYPQLSQEQMDELAKWEAMLCDAGKGERLAFRPARNDSWRSLSRRSKIELSTCRACRRSLRLKLCLKHTP